MGTTMTPTMNDDPWAQIVRGSESWVGRRFEGAHILSPFWAVHPNGAPGIVVRDIEASAVPKDLPKPRGIALGVESDGVNKVTLTMFLQTPEDRDVFQKLCSDIAAYSAVTKDRHDASVRIFSRLRRWQSLLGLARGQEMSEQELRGLLAELWVLTKQLKPKLGLLGALRAWVAPERHPQDFALPNGVVEVKSRVTGSRPEVQISSLEQLERGHLPLYLMVVELTPVEHGLPSLSLNDVAAGLLIEADSLGVATFELAHRLLADRGYVASTKYDQYCYEIAGVTAFQVGETFPCLLRASTDPRITDANYSLELTALTEFRQNPDSVIAAACSTVAPQG